MTAHLPLPQAIFHIDPTCPARRPLQPCPSPSMTGMTAEYLGWVTVVFTSHVCMPVSCFQIKKLFLVGTMLPVRPEADLDWKSKYRSLYRSSNKLFTQSLAVQPRLLRNLFSSSCLMITGLGFYPLPLPPTYNFKFTGVGRPVRFSPRFPNS